jgi:Fe-S-cluster-containing dehydrogenase component
MEYTDQELRLAIFNEFPSDLNSDVCPVKAISWPIDSDAPVINQDTCIMCGLCVTRCPVSAISLNVKKGAIINDEPNNYFLLSDTSSKYRSEESLRLFSTCHTTGIIIRENDDLFRRIYERIVRVAPSQEAQFPNLLTRNLFLNLGIKSAMRRLGDTNIRMDLIIEPENFAIGTAEVELGNGVLDAPRNILDNIAILASRYKIKKDKILPVVVSLCLPNQRSEYWQVIKDISTVLGIYIGSFTIGALILLNWNRCHLFLRNTMEVYADSDSHSIRKQMELILGRPIDARDLYPGFIESQK